MRIFQTYGFKIIPFCLVILLMAPALRPQTIEYGKLTGTVVDEEGAPLPGVTVEITSPALMGGKRATQTSARGSYVFMNLPLANIL